MLHCVSFRHNKVYFLFDNKDFRHRYILIGYCPKCKKTIAEVHEERKADGKLFVEQKSGAEAISYLARIVTNIDYSTEKKKEKNVPIGWKFGVNVQTKKGIKQYSCDFRGKRELVKVIP